MVNKSEISQTVALVHVKGLLMGGPETSELSDQIQKAYLGGHYKIVIDLSNVCWANSHAVGMMMKWFVTVRDKGGDIRFAGLNDKLISYLTLTNLSSVLPTFQNIDAAIDSFNEPAVV